MNHALRNCIRAPWVLHRLCAIGFALAAALFFAVGFDRAHASNLDPATLFESESPASSLEEQFPTWTATLSVVFVPGTMVYSALGRGRVPVSTIIQDESLRRTLLELGAKGIEAAFPSEVTGATNGATASGLARFLHIDFESPEDALRAAEVLSANPSVIVAQPIPDQVALDDPTEDPYLSDSWWFTEDSQWCLQNRGRREGMERCGHAVAGSDIRVASVWRDYYHLGLNPANREPIGSPNVVLAFVDQGIADHHPEIHVLTEFSNDSRFSFCPGSDRFGGHATKMSGLAAMIAGNGIGAAGVCGDCSVLDIVAPSCACGAGDDPTKSCDTVSPIWYTKLVEAAGVPLGTTPDGRPRMLKVVNASFGAVNYAPLEQVEALWKAHNAGILTVAGAGDYSYDSPRPIEPANIPFVLGVGGHTWEDRFWDASVSCYGRRSGTSIGRDVVDLTAPASGPMLSASPTENHPGSGPYAWTSGQCSAAAALVTGAAGLVQSYALDRSPLRRHLSPDELAGLLTATTRSYAVDPTKDATCPPSLCPRSYYGTGMLSVENAFFALTQADEWQERFVGIADGCEVVFQPPEFVDARGRTWREYKVSWSFALEPRSDDLTAPADLPRYVAWPLRSGSTTPCNYGEGAERILYAEAGIRDCSLELDRSTGTGRLIGTNFVEVRGGREIPLVPWNEVRMGMGYWSGRSGNTPAPDVLGSNERHSLIRVIGPNPFRSSVRFQLVSSVPSDGVIDVLDVSGRVVTVLRSGPLPRAEEMLEWDGRDAQNRTVPAGLYWLRLRAGETSGVRPVVRVE